MVQTHQHSREEGTTSPLSPQEADNICHGPKDPRKVIQLYYWEHLDWLHHRLIRQQLGIWPQGATEGSAYDPVHLWGRAPCHPGPPYQAVSEEDPKNGQRFQPLLSMLPHDKRYWSTKSRTEMILNSFYPPATRLLSSWSNGHPDYFCCCCTGSMHTHWTLPTHLLHQHSYTHTHTHKKYTHTLTKKHTPKHMLMPHTQTHYHILHIHCCYCLLSILMA
jgi:hypothetical protein